MENKVIILYQVIFSYRAPIYNRIAQNQNFETELWHCPDMKGTKKINFKGDLEIKTKVLKTLFMNFATANTRNVLPISPFLLFNLIAKQPTVVLSEGTSSIFNSSIGFIYCKLFRKKFIWWSLGELEGREFTGFRKLLDRWIKYIERHSDAIFTYSTQGERYFLRNGIAEDRIFKGVNVIDTESKLKEIKKLKENGFNFIFEEGRFNIVFVGAFIKEKRLELLIDAFRKLSEVYSNISLHLIGGGIYIDVIKEYVDSFGSHKDSIIFYGPIHDGLSEYLLQSDVLVLPGLGGLSICDGMIHGLPVITGKADGTEKDLITEECGFYLPDIDADSLFEKLLYLYENPEIKIEMGAAGFERITKKFGIDNYMKTLFNCIQSVI